MLCWLCVCVVFSVTAAAGTKPHIIFILADDLGFNDVGFHGSNQVATPNIDALAYSGLLLHNYYVAPLCTPSRAALMTGKHPIHTGMQHSVIYGAEPRGLPLSEKLLPQYLRELGYATHLVGKWHLGSYRRDYLPLSRGFDSHLGFWSGKIDMYDHTNQEKGTWGHDFRRGFEWADDLFGQYATDVYTKEANKLIMSHNLSRPMFLLVAHSAVHSGNPGEPLRAPDHVLDQLSHIQDYQRRKYAAMLSKLDESVGAVVAALQARAMLDNSIIVFSTDNGGPAAGFNDNAASNYPLRGVKNTLWEGGVRGAALLWSAGLARRGGRLASQKMFVADWLPTLHALAGGNNSILATMDGVDLWGSLVEDTSSPRHLVVHNIDNLWGSAALTHGPWKIVKGTNYGGAWDSWYGPSGREGTYDLDLVYRSDAGVAISKIVKLPSREHITNIRGRATVTCPRVEAETACKPLEAPCLFNVEEDPCERRNLANQEPVMLQTMLSLLERVNKTVVPPNNKPLDPCGDPKYWGRLFTNFGDYLPSITCNS